jgi:Recombinase
MRGKPWNPGRVRGVLSNELYTGCLVWGKSSRKLPGPTPESEWVVVPNVLPRLIPQAQFDRMQNLLLPVRRMSNELLLAKLKRLLSQKGTLSRIIIDRSPSMPASATYRYRFGSLQKAYELIGYELPPKRLTRMQLAREGHAYRNQVADSLVRRFPDRLRKLKQHVSGDRCPLLLLDGDVSMSVRICRQITVGNKLKWDLRKSVSARADFSLLCLMNRRGKEIAAYYLYRNLDSRKHIYFTAHSLFLGRGVKLHSIDQLPTQIALLLQEAPESHG